MSQLVSGSVLVSGSGDVASMRRVGSRSTRAEAGLAHPPAGDDDEIASRHYDTLSVPPLPPLTVEDGPDGSVALSGLLCLADPTHPLSVALASLEQRDVGRDSARHRRVVVETTTGYEYEGELVSADASMNVMLKEALVGRVRDQGDASSSSGGLNNAVKKQPPQRWVASTFIRGSQIALIRLPDCLGKPYAVMARALRRERFENIRRAKYQALQAKRETQRKRRDKQQQEGNVVPRAAVSLHATKDASASGRAAAGAFGRSQQQRPVGLQRPKR